MDAQAQDRCHRIGQTRDVHIYRLISEHTIEENILKRSRQKRFLDEIVIQDANFTTDWFSKQQQISADDTTHEAEEKKDDVFDGQEQPLTRLDDWKQLFDTGNYQSDAVGATLKSSLNPREAAEAQVNDVEAVMMQAELNEDERDVQAMRQARIEAEAERGIDLEDFGVPEDDPGSQDAHTMPENQSPENLMETESDGRIVSELDVVHSQQLNLHVNDDNDVGEDDIGHVDDYLLRFMERELLGEYFELVHAPQPT